MEIKDLVIDVKRTVGDDLVLVDVAPVFVYEDGKRTDKIIGYRYVVSMPRHAFDKISVKIDGDKQLEMPENEYPVVEFDDLEIRVYWTPDGYRVGASATGIRMI